MLNPFALISSRYRLRYLYPFVSAAVALSLVLGTPQLSQAGSLFDLILRGVEIIQLSNVSDKQEVNLGKQINQQLVNSEIRLYRNRQINRYVNQIGQRLAKKSIRPEIPYTFQVVDDKNINAFATMGGFVYINTGLMKAADNESELASVISHEIAHIAGRHALGQMRQMAIARGVATVAGVDDSQLVGIGVELALRRPHSRQDEREADQLGLENLKQAGYAPIGAVDFMKKLMKAGGGRSMPAFLSTHPATSERVESLEQSINPAQARVGDGLDNNAYKRRISVL
ncbi:MAG: M48 family metalloprotease [Symploca sp. SIO3C6]|uniref:M48 family metalloprotease n=1 Tax=Symploca sp. SIO1C4 TaxID=2607765 RepID=A0A6B3ND88_9CYAN|nr:M48 family metalloprotease [Symploca sp. SIO3C6]NER31059.1 M48 family metalloprotease [Symploca sp. SIO1C4]NET05224.1 M48 family metalloprotease [Symploca sp. SIO2B6]NET50183.1 M48 family metalloprotease [Merismopedia sp. SIO2A8]